jgi:hypothetical protein
VVCGIVHDGDRLTKKESASNVTARSGAFGRPRYTGTNTTESENQRLNGVDG